MFAIGDRVRFLGKPEDPAVRLTGTVSRVATVTCRHDRPEYGGSAELHREFNLCLPDEIEADHDARAMIWREVSESFYYQALEVVPPIFVRGGFLVGEAWKDNANGEPLHAAFTSKRGRFFATVSTRSGFESKRDLLVAALDHEAAQVAAIEANNGFHLRDARAALAAGEPDNGEG